MGGIGTFPNLQAHALVTLLSSLCSRRRAIASRSRVEVLEVGYSGIADMSTWMASVGAELKRDRF